MKQEHIEQCARAAAAVQGKTVTHLYLVACGGSKAFMHPSQYILDEETEIPSSVYSSNEFVHRCPKARGENSVVITCSHSGNTPETVRATSLAREKGARALRAIDALQPAIDRARERSAKSTASALQWWMRPNLICRRCPSICEGILPPS